MSRSGFSKSVRLFRKFSDESLRRRGGNQAGREGVTALAAIEAVLRAERLFDGSLLEPLAAFTSLLQSSQLPPELGNFSFGDALLAIEDAHAELRQDTEQIWEFSPELAADVDLRHFSRAPASALQSDPEHAMKLRAFVLDAAQSVAPGSLLVVGALAAPELPLAELCARFQRVTLSDLELEPLEELVRRAAPEAQRARIKLERYDVTGSYVEFAAGAKRVVAAATDAASAEQGLLDWLQSYDVGAKSAGLSALEEKPDLAISAMLLSELGRGYAPCIAAELDTRSFDGTRVGAAPLAPALALFRAFIVQHHVQALLRRAKSAALISAVSQVELPGNGEPHDLLDVEQLVERLPQITEPKAEQSWERRRDLAAGAEKRSQVTLVQALLV